jgi:hypothetical protein
MRRRGSLFWGCVLILLALLLLLKQMGMIAGDIFGYFWPILVIAFGIWFIVGYFTRSHPVAREQVSIPLEGAVSAAIRLDHAAGKLTLCSGAGPNEIVNGLVSDGLSIKSLVEAGRMDVRLRPSQQAWGWWPGDSLDWDIHLNREIPLSLKIDSGANTSILDLSDLKITDLDIDTGASSTVLTLPASAGNTRADIDTGASSLKINIPAGVAAKIQVKSGIASVTVDARFPRITSGLYQSSDYGTAVNKVDLTINAGVGSIEII